MEKAAQTAAAALSNLPSLFPKMDRGRRFAMHSRAAYVKRIGGKIATAAGEPYQHHLHPDKKGSGVGATKIGKGSKIVTFTDSHGSPIAAVVEEAGPNENQSSVKVLE